MDGSIRNSMFNGSRIRLSSSTYATEVFPRYVYFLALGTLLVDAKFPSDGIRLVYMTIPDGTVQDGNRTVVLSQDFDRIKSVAEHFSPQPRIFPSEPDSDVLARIAASLKVAFSDRSLF